MERSLKAINKQKILDQVAIAITHWLNTHQKTLGGYDLDTEDHPLLIRPWADYWIVALTLHRPVYPQPGLKITNIYILAKIDEHGRVTVQEKDSSHTGHASIQLIENTATEIDWDEDKPTDDLDIQTLLERFGDYANELERRRTS